MVELRGGLGFRLKTLEGQRRGEVRVADHFQGDEPVEADLARAIDDAHAAAAEGFEQFVVAEAAACARARSQFIRSAGFQRGAQPQFHKAHRAMARGRVAAYLRFASGACSSGRHGQLSSFSHFVTDVHTKNQPGVTEKISASTRRFNRDMNVLTTDEHH